MRWANAKCAEIEEYVETYAQASRDAVFGAGFDGVEVHCAHGYLIDQFIQDTCNKRTDEYGGSIENRCRFALEVIDTVVKAVGPTKTGFRLSPWSTFQGTTSSLLYMFGTDEWGTSKTCGWATPSRRSLTWSPRS